MKRLVIYVLIPALVAVVVVGVLKLIGYGGDVGVIAGAVAGGLSGSLGGRTLEKDEEQP